MIVIKRNKMVQMVVDKMYYKLVNLMQMLYIHLLQQNLQIQKLCHQHIHKVQLKMIKNNNNNKNKIKKRMKKK